MPHGLQGLIIVRSSGQDQEPEEVQTVEETLDDLLGYGHYRPSTFAAKGLTAFEVNVDPSEDGPDEDQLLNAVARASNEDAVLFVDLSQPLRPRAHGCPNSTDKEPLAQAADMLTSFVTSSYMSLVSDIQRGQ